MDEHAIQQRLTHLEVATGMYDGLTYDEWIEYGEIRRCTKAYIQSHPEIQEKIENFHKKMDEFEAKKPFSHDSKRIEVTATEKQLELREAAIAEKEKQLANVDAIIEKKLRDKGIIK